MDKLVVLKVGHSSFLDGFPVILQIGKAGAMPVVERSGQLPPAPDLPACYQQWQSTYRALRLPHRLGIRPDSVRHMSWEKDCREAAQRLRDRTAVWLNHPDFQPLYSKLLEQLSPQDTIRLVLQTEDATLQRLPWHSWDFFDRYPQAELTLSAPFFEQVVARPTRSRNVRVLAVFGDATGLDLETDRALLENLPGIELQILTAPNRQSLTQSLWESKGWDILFFAGHSNSFSTGATAAGETTTGQIGLNATDTLTIPNLKYALKKAVKRGLAIAIFNSCDGLGLAQDLAELHIPQVVVMREPVPDPVAHNFLKGFLDSFARNTPLHLALREAREQLQGLEDAFPCASWLPILCQNLALQPPSWASLQGVDPVRRRPWKAVAGCAAVVGTTLGLEGAGGFQAAELKMYDFFMRRRPFYEQPDERIVIIANTQQDIPAEGRVANPPQSMNDATLLRILEQLEDLQPKVVGLDIYRDRYSDPASSALPEQLNQLPNLVAICKHPAISMADSGIAPPPEMTALDQRLGFSDFPEDVDNIARRWLAVTVPEETNCPTYYSFALVVATRFLEQRSSKQSLDDRLWVNTPEGSNTPILGPDGVKVPRLSAQTGGYRLSEEMMGGYQSLINYRHLPNIDSIAGVEVSVTDFLNGQFEAEAFRDRIVLIGTTDRTFGGSPNTRDIWQTPYTTSKLLEDSTPGVYVQAHLISQIISAAEDGRPLPWSWAETIEKSWIVVWGLGGGLLAWLFSHERANLFWLVLIASEAGLILVCWGLLGLLAGWVPYVPTAIACIGSALVVRQINSHSYEGKQ